MAVKGHTCQPFVGVDRFGTLESDPDFPLPFQRDPWCWSPERGFHRVSRPRARKTLRTPPDSRYVGKDFIADHQALALGYGIGTSNLAARVTDFVSGFVGVGQHISIRDPEIFAVFGRAAREYEHVRDAPAPALAALHRGVFRTAYDVIAPPPGLLGPWHEVLERVASGEPVAPATVAWATSTGGAVGWRRRDAESQRDHVAGRTFQAMYDGGYGGDSRALAHLLAMTEPTEEATVTWLRVVGDAIGRRVEAWSEASAADPGR